MKMIVGVDEAGRGPLAGPVAVGVAVVPGNFDWSSKLPGVNDSKQLSEKQREVVFAAAQLLQRTGELQLAVSMVSAGVIDRIGIVLAINLAMKRALKRLYASPSPRSDLGLGEVQILLDGGLRAPVEYQNQTTIIRGDASEPVIGLASIAAKVTRDRYMVRLAARSEYVKYDFATHKGYGTRSHRAAISEHGFSFQHRRSFCRNIHIP